MRHREPGGAFSPSTSWAEAGPIIEREQIDLVSDFGRWMARHSKRDDYSRPNVSPLVAAMRAYLAWDYGDEVPQETALAPEEKPGRWSTQIR